MYAREQRSRGSHSRLKVLPNYPIVCIRRYKQQTNSYFFYKVSKELSNDNCQWRTLLSISNSKFSLLVPKQISASHSHQKQILASVNQSKLFILAKNKFWREIAVWCHNCVCIAWYKHGNWPITRCVIGKLFYKIIPGYITNLKCFFKDIYDWLSTQKSLCCDRKFKQSWRHFNRKNSI